MLEDSIMQDYLNGPEEWPEIKKIILTLNTKTIFELARLSGWLLYTKNDPDEEEWEEFTDYKRDSRIFISAVDFLTALLHAGRYPGEDEIAELKQKEKEDEIKIENIPF